MYLSVLESHWVIGRMNFRVKALLAICGLIVVGIVLRYGSAVLPSVVGILFIIAGFSGIIRGKIGVSGKRGPIREYKGCTARLIGIAAILVGALAVPLLLGKTFW